MRRALARINPGAEVVEAAYAAHHGPKHLLRYEDLLADSQIDAVYNPLPNHLHVPWSIRAAEAGKPILAICAGYQLLGESFYANGRAYAGLNILDLRSDRGPSRAVGEIAGDTAPQLGLGPITGFENHGGRTHLGEAVQPLARVTAGIGNDGATEGACHGKVLGTYCHGPALSRNPALADLLLTEPLPRAVIMVGAYAPCARFIRLARESGLDALFLNVSFVGSSALARELGEGVDGVLVTQVVPDPLDTSLPLIREYRADLRRSAQAAPTFISLEGYVAARILLAALERLEGPPDREKLIDALEGLGSFDLGLGRPLRLAPGEHQASRAVWPTRLSDGRFIPFDGAGIGALLPPPEEAP